ncbi:acetyl-CoA carboxylase [Edwardsiella piscicida]|uniref:acetyl-CoA carboxylase n=1 Tax=Edwardsiella piscicida TaxID=1263550 RepID=UPI00370D1773
MSKAVLWLGVGLMALYVGGAAAEPNTSVAIDAPQPVIASHAAASPSAAPAAPSGAAQAQIKVPAASLRYAQALQLAFYHEVYRRCNQQNSLSPLYSATVDALRTVTSLGEKNRLTDLLYNEMAGNALGMAMASDPDRQRCAVAGDIYQQLLNSAAPGALQQDFRLQLPADKPPHA